MRQDGRRWVMILTATTVLGMTGAADASGPDGERLYRRHCAPCHGPAGRGDGPDASLFVPPPPNLREGILVRHDPERLARRVLDGTPLALAHGPSAEHDRTEQVEALVTHLKRLPTINWSRLETGEALWVDQCESCHGPFGRPPPGSAVPDLSSPAWQAAHDDARLTTLVRHVPPGQLGLHETPDAADTRALVTYVRFLSPGFELYSRYCATCHGEDGRGAGATEIGRENHPTVIFDRAWAGHIDDERLRARVWHMMAGQKPTMPHLRHRLDEAQVGAIIAYLRGLPPER